VAESTPQDNGKLLPGQAVDFPGWMEPFFFPFFGEGERPTITVDVLITGGKHAELT